jgi:hypothetical protein
MGADTYAALGAGFSRLSELFAQRLGMSMEEKRALAHEEAMQKREIAAEKRAEARQIAAEDRQYNRQATTPVERKVFQSGADQGPPLLMVDELNQFGSSIRQTPASQREKEEFAANARAAAEKSAMEGKEFKDGFWVNKKTGSVEAVPEYLAAQERQKAAGRTNVTVNADGTPPTAFEKELDKKDAVYYDSLRAAATTAASTKQRLDVIKGITSKAATGKIPEALAIAGQYFGTEAGKDLQTFNAATQPLFLDMAEQMKGALSDKDREALQQAIPRFGNDPRANKVVVDILETAANRAQSTYKEADDYAQKNRGLRGFVPSSAKAQKPEEKPAQGTYSVGSEVNVGGKRYRVVPGGTPDDPELEEI